MLFRFITLFLFAFSILCSFAGEDWQGIEHARRQIQKHRMADLTIKVVDQQGRPVTGATVNVKMVKHSFPFGSAINALMAFDENDPNPEMQKYLDVFKENFNSAVMENAMKWYGMTEDDGSPDTKNIEKMWQCVKWLDEHNIELRGHNAIWPSWKNSPDYMHDLRLQPDKVRQECKERVQTVVSMFQGKLTDWDLINE